MSANHTTLEQAQQWYRSMMITEAKLSEIVSPPYTRSPSIMACRGDEEPLVERVAGGLCFLSDLEIFGAGAPHRYLKAGGDADTNAHRLELIQAVSDGKRLELVVKRALAYRQPKGKPNRRGLRFSDEQLPLAAGSWKGQPFLVDHNTYEQDARKGSILTSEYDLDPKGVPALFMGFAVVKPDAVISVLDGTIDRFSIGWFSTGPVICTVHGCDVTSDDSCYCWPLDVVELDGKKKIVEYEYQSFSGKELSAVNVPAVIGTKIEEYHAALTAELHLPPRTPKAPKERAMAGFPKLAAALALTSLGDTDEDRAVAAVTALRERAAAAELDAGTQRAEVVRLTSELAAQTALAATASAAATDALIAEAYKAGKLCHGKDAEGKPTPDALEQLLRDYGKTAGRDKLAAKLSEMQARIPLGARPVDQAGEPPRPAPFAIPSDAQLASLAASMGVPVDDVRAKYGLPPLGQAAGGAR